MLTFCVNLLDKRKYICYNIGADTNLCLIHTKGIDGMKKNEMRGIVLGVYPTITAFAREVNWTRQKASSIISFKQEPSLDDCYVIARAVGRDADEIASIFLKMKTQKCV